jgi:hypothetical protein
MQVQYFLSQVETAKDAWLESYNFCTGERSVALASPAAEPLDRIL